MSDVAYSSTRIDKDIVLETARTVLRALREADIAILHKKIFGVPDVMKWVFSGKTFTDTEADLFIRKNFSAAPSPIGLSVLTGKTTNDILGFAGLNRCNALLSDDLEVGFVLAREAWGRGLATEIGQAQLDFGFRQIGCARLLALAAAENEGSIRALEKLGMRYHSDVRPADRTPRRVFSLTSDEWHAAQR